MVLFGNTVSVLSLLPHQKPPKDVIGVQFLKMKEPCEVKNALRYLMETSAYDYGKIVFETNEYRILCDVPDSVENVKDVDVSKIDRNIVLPHCSLNDE